MTLNQWAQGSSPWRCTHKRALNRKILRSFSFMYPKKSGSARSVHGFCTVGVFVGISCKCRNYSEYHVKFCIRSAEPSGVEPLLQGLHSSKVLPRQTPRWSVRLRRVQPAGWVFRALHRSLLQTFSQVPHERTAGYGRRCSPAYLP